VERLEAETRGKALLLATALGKSEQEARELLDGETVLNAEQALELGLVDRILETSGQASMPPGKALPEESNLLRLELLIEHTPPGLQRWLLERCHAALRRRGGRGHRVDGFSWPCPRCGTIRTSSPAGGCCESLAPRSRAA
jgi:enoyl-CoA hydratase/carnithine racemase